jgi:hypothetical protein
MGLLDYFEECLEVICECFRDIEQQVPAPSKVPFLDSFVFRYKEQKIEQCIVAKLVRVLTGVRAAIVLNRVGLFQEQAVQHRVLDELGEDIMFLGYGIHSGEITELHQEYLKAFFMEDFENAADPVGSRINRPMLSRKKIRAYISRIEETELDPSTGVHVSKTLSQTYSGFVHVAAPQVMELYSGFRPRFHLEGMLNTPREGEYTEDLANYVYRALINVMFVALTFGMQEMVANLYKYRAKFEKEIGFDYLERDTNDS